MGQLGHGLKFLVKRIFGSRRFAALAVQDPPEGFTITGYPIWPAMLLA